MGIKLGNLSKSGSSLLNLYDLRDVNIVDPETGQFLRFDLPSLTWINSSLENSLLGSSGVIITPSTDDLNTLTFSLGDITPTSVSTPLLTMTGTGARIRGDFSNATPSSRSLFQTSTVGGGTAVTAIPNGVSTASGFYAHNNSNANTGNYAGFGINSTLGYAYLESQRLGTDPFLPLILSTSGVPSLTVETNGDITINRAGARIKGDFSTTTVANRPMFQTSTVNGITIVGALPNGASQGAVFQAINNSDPSNASYCNLGVSSAQAYVESGRQLGTGTYLPLAFYTGGLERVNIAPAGFVGIGGANNGAYGTLDVQRAGYTAISVTSKDASPAVTVLVSNSNQDGRVGTVTPHQFQILGNGNVGMVVTTAGNCVFGGPVNDTTAKIQTANGIKLGNTNNASPLVLDYYEEGTFTPSATGTGTAGTATYSTRVGRYQRIGNRVNIQLVLSFTGHTGTGGCVITGLPFVSNANVSFSTFSLYSSGWNASGNVMQTYMPPNDASIGIDARSSSGGAIALPFPPAVQPLIIQGSYEV